MQRFLRLGLLAAALLVLASTQATARDFRSADVHAKDYPTNMAVKHMGEELSKATNGKYNVKISFSGSRFAGFADPRTASEGSADPGGPLLSQGNITGSIQYNGIVSTTAPDPANVRATQAPNASLGAVLTELFHGHNGAAASTHYLISYTPTTKSVNVTGSGNTWATGDTYTQAG